MSRKPKPRYDVVRITADMSRRSWNPSDLARESGKSKKTINRFLIGDVQSPKTAAAIARALGRKVTRYLAGVETPDGAVRSMKDVA